MSYSDIRRTRRVEPDEARFVAVRDGARDADERRRMIRVVSLFSGGGFAELALMRASDRMHIPVDIVFAVDSWASAARVRDANLPGVRTTIADVKTLKRGDLPPHDLVIGGPPCQDHSLAGARSCRCDRGEPPVDRCCLADFVRLRGDSWLMENVRPRLAQSWSEQFCAADFGDATSRKRWFYASHLLLVHATQPRRTIADIRDPAADSVARDARERMIRTVGARARRDEEPLGSLTGATWPHEGHYFAIGMRGHSASASASAFREDQPLGSFVSNSWHGNQIARLGPGVRNPSVLEMQRAHSIPDCWDWAGTTKTDRGRIIANGWPVELGAALCSAMLRAIRPAVVSAA